MSKHLDGLSKATRAELVAMTPAEIRNIADCVHIHRIHAEQASYPSDPEEGLSKVRELMRRDYVRKIDDPVYHVLNSLALLRLACIGGSSGDDDLDKTDLLAMVYLIDDAFCVLREHEHYQREVSTRLRQITHPIKK